ncbi:MAG: NAD(P)/FAD-dependent oxidoreductase [Lachnospiraceae bacterium]|nr:NAD(P)/FAD-dependent oxidoreductase [Lachnospiraceae bacterium]
MAAFYASGHGRRVTVIERNEKAGKKIYITGKGRCNLTNLRPVPEFLDHVVTNPRFLYKALYAFTPEDTIAFFEANGCPLKVERGERVFPVSDHASDVTRALFDAAKKSGVNFIFNERIKSVVTNEGGVTGVLLESGRRIDADAVILATGGRSYPSTGSTGDGYEIAKKLGHSVKDQQPSLVSMHVGWEYCRELEGLSLKNVGLSLLDGNKKLFADRGEMLFTHFGVSGPLVLSASARYNESMKNAVLKLDLKPALSHDELMSRLLRDFDKYRNKVFRNSLDDLFPKRLAPVMARLSGIDPAKRAGEVSKEERSRFAQLIKGVNMTVTGTGGFAEAVITRGGIDVKEIDPATMGSRLVRGLYFAGEVIDVDALTGGYNLQIAWSTGRLAGLSAAKDI